MCFRFCVRARGQGASTPCKLLAPVTFPLLLGHSGAIMIPPPLPPPLVVLISPLQLKFVGHGARSCSYARIALAYILVLLDILMFVAMISPRTVVTKTYYCAYIGNICPKLYMMLHLGWIASVRLLITEGYTVGCCSGTG